MMDEGNYRSEEAHPAKVRRYEGLRSNVKAAEALQAEDVDLPDDLMRRQVYGAQLGHQPGDTHDHCQVGCVSQ